MLVPILLFAGASPVYAGRCNTGVHQPSLDALSATPTTGTPTTTIQFSLVYRDTRGCEPSSVTILIPGVGSIAMGQAGGTFKGGMTYTASSSLPTGTWTFGASATSGFGPGVKTVVLDGPSPIVISSPTPTPTPTPKPTPSPKPTPPPTPRPTPRPTPAPSATPTATPSASQTAGPTLAPSPSAKPGAPGPKPTQKPGTSPAGRPDGSSGAPSPTPAPSDSGSGIAGGGLGGPAGPGGSPARGDDRGDAGPSGMVPILLAVVVLTFAGGLLVVARRRRRPTSAADAVPAEAPHEPVVEPAAIELGPLSPIDPALQGDLPSRPALRFAKPPRAGTVRGTIAYRHVRVSAGPDDLRFAELARLEQRDEVEVIGETAGYLQVRLPDGLTGWVPRMVFVTASGPGPVGARPAGA